MSLLCGLASVLSPSANHTFAETTLFDEIALKAANLLIEEIVRLVNKADSYIRNHRK
jgi:hypothetical protein